jgi:hypothetical protein
MRREGSQESAVVFGFGGRHGGSSIHLHNSAHFNEKFQEIAKCLPGTEDSVLSNDADTVDS